MSAPIVNLLLNALQLLQGAETRSEVERLLPGAQPGAQPGACPDAEDAELQSEIREAIADDLLFDFDSEERPRHHARAKHLHVDVIGLDDGY